MPESAEKVLHFLFQPHSGCKSIHDIGTPLQLPGELFPQGIVTAAALEKSFVVFHGKIQGAVPVQAPAEASLRYPGKSQQIPAFLLRQELAFPIRNALPSSMISTLLKTFSSI